MKSDSERLGEIANAIDNDDEPSLAIELRSIALRVRQMEKTLDVIVKLAER